MHPLLWAIGGSIFILSIKHWKKVLKSDNKELIEMTLEQYSKRNNKILSKIKNDLSNGEFDQKTASIIREKLVTLGIQN